MSKSPLSEDVMTEAAYVDQAARWAQFLTQVEARGPGDIPNAWRRLEHRYGVTSHTFWSLRYRKPKGILVGIYAALKAAYDSECQRQFRRYQHEISIAKQLGVFVDDLEEPLSSVASDQGSPEEL
jgi:hypothetical protein